MDTMFKLVCIPEKPMRTYCAFADANTSSLIVVASTLRLRVANAVHVEYLLLSATTPGVVPG
jgi:hypothetical protein